MCCGINGHKMSVKSVGLHGVFNNLTHLFEMNTHKFCGDLKSFVFVWPKNKKKIRKSKIETCT